MKPNAFVGLRCRLTQPTKNVLSTQSVLTDFRFVGWFIRVSVAKQ
ncbi:hypothetical protein [Dolichospermum sp. UHCC 0352]|nr:hypothetical protein [Dolichospermum sp. UHCC 0352]